MRIARAACNAGSVITTFTGSADFAADTTVVLICVGVDLTSIGVFQIAVSESCIAGAHAARTGLTLCHGIGIGRTGLAAATAVGRIGGDVDLTAIGHSPIAVVEVGVAARDAAVARRAARDAVGHRSAHLAARSAVACICGSVRLAAVHWTRFARPVRSRAYRRGAASSGARRRRRPYFRTRISAVSTVRKVARSVYLAPVGPSLPT